MLDNEALNTGHGEAWAEMVRDLKDYACEDLELCAEVSFVGGYDFEYYQSPQWDCRRQDNGHRGPCPNGDASGADQDEWSLWIIDEYISGTKYWADGFASFGSEGAFNFGSCEACPRTGNPPAWNQDDDDREVLERVYHVSYGLPGIWPLPQIYVGPYVWQWYNVKWWAYSQHSATMRFMGVVTGCAADPYDLCQPDLTDTPSRLPDKFNEVCTTQYGADCIDSWEDYECVSGPIGGSGCRYLPPHIGWQALTDMLSSSFAPPTGDPATPTRVSNPTLPMQSSLQYGVTDIRAQATPTP